MRTLRLDQHERTHVFRLSGVVDPSHVDGCHALPDTIQPLLDQLEPFPAAVVNGRYDVLAYNRTYSALMGPFDDAAHRGPQPAALMFTDPEVRARMVDWEQAASFLVATFRAGMAKHLGEPAWKCFLTRMLSCRSSPRSGSATRCGRSSG